MLIQKLIDFQTLTFLTLDNEYNPFRVSRIAANDDIDEFFAAGLPCVSDSENLRQ